MGAERGKKGRNFGRSGGGGVPRVGPEGWGTFLGGPRQIPLLAQTTFCPDHFWPRTLFGRFRLVRHRRVGFEGCVLKGGAPKCEAPNCGGSKSAGPNLEKVGHEGWGPEGQGARRVEVRRVQAPTWKKWGHEGWGPEGRGAQNFALFFTLPPLFSFFLPLLGVVSWNFGGVIEGWNPQTCTIGVLGLSCAAPAAPKPPGFHTIARETKSAHWRVPAFNHTTKIQRNDPQERKKERKWEGGERKKKRAKFWAVRRRGVQRRGRSQGERPNFGRTHENLEHTPHRHTTPQHSTTHRVVLGKGVPRKGVHGPKKKKT